MSHHRVRKQLFLSYAPADEVYFVELEKHLALLEREGLVDVWSPRKLSAGVDQRGETHRRIQAAHIVLLLVSANFFAYDLCCAEMEAALARHETQEVAVLPVPICPCDWGSTPLGKLRAIPHRTTPVSTFANRDLALVEVALAVRSLIQTGSVETAEPDVADMVIRPYVKLLSHRIGEMAFVARTVHSQRRGQVLIGNGLDEDLFTSERDTLFLEGWSGRGKTTVMRLLARKAIAKEKNGRAPIFLRAERVTHTLPLAILTELRQATVCFRDEAEITTWLGSHPTLLLIDDWHQASPVSRRIIEDYLDTMRPVNMDVAVAGAPGSQPKLSKVHRVEIGRYSLKDRDAVVRAFFGKTNFDYVQWFLENIPAGVADLLLEPIVLDMCLKLVRRSPAGRIRFPRNVPDLMDSLLKRMLSPRHENAQRRATEVERVCAQLTRAPGRIHHKTIQKAIQEVGIEGSVREFEEDLEACGILRRDGTGYEFEHEIWRRSFEAKARADDGQWDTPEDVEKWVEASAPEELFSMLPFVAGLLREPAQQSAFFDALLSKNIELYFRALTMRASVRATMNEADWAGWCLQELYHGYVDLIERHFGGFSPSIEPWCFDNGTGTSVVLHGSLGARSLDYSFGLGVEPNILLRHDASASGARIATQDDVADGDPISDREGSPILAFSGNVDGRIWHGMDLALTLMRPGSTRLVAAKLCLANLKNALGTGLVLCPWFVRERFGSAFVSTEREGGFEDWLKKSTAEIVVLAQCALREPEGEPVEAADGDCFFCPDFGADKIRDLVLFGNVLVEYGLGEVPLGSLVLPWEERGDDGQYVYSEARRVERVCALYMAAAETYRLICEWFSAEVRELIFFSQWPCRAIVEIEMVGGKRNPGVCMYWDPCQDWDSEPCVRAVFGRSEMLRGEGGYPVLQEQARERCEGLGRRFDYLHTVDGSVSWAFSADAVTEVVVDLLRDDIEQLESLIRGGM